MDQRHDEELLARIKLDDRAAYKLLVERYLNKIWRLAFNILYDKQDAEDVTQEVFITVWNNRKQWSEGDAAFSTWLYRVAVNKSIDFKRRRKPNHVEVDENLVDEDDKASDEMVIDRQFRSAFKECLQTLPEKQMTCLLLFYYEELNISEICDKLSASEDSVRSLLKRGRMNLKGLLRDKFGDDVCGIQ